MSGLYAVRNCRSCGAEILWAVTDRGRRMPVDAEPAAGGNVALVSDGKQLRAVYVDPDTQPDLRLSHFATCPNAAEHRKTDRPAEPNPDGPVTSPDEETHVTRTESIPITAGVEAIEELAALMAETDTASMTSGARRLDYRELAGLSLGYWLRRSRSRSNVAAEAEASTPAPTPRAQRDADEAADPDEMMGGA